MTDQIKKLLAEVEEFQASDAETLEAQRVKWLGRKGEIHELFDAFRTVPPEQKKEVGRLLNELKEKATSKVNALREQLTASASTTVKPDLTLPGLPVFTPGSRHPISIVRNRIIEIFSHIGFTVSDGKEIEDEWHNFSALNTPADHPARDMQDTFYVSINPERMLRTQTSSVQVHIMQNSKPPIRTISPGRVYRNEAISARAHCQFHQVEGLYIDDRVSFADLKQTLLYFAREMFGPDTQIRLRPSYFPFTEPSAEMDISCTLCKGAGCNVCKHTGWVEILGCGMVDPQVLINCGIDENKYRGFAFGMGIERIAMLRYVIKDLRVFFENDIRVIQQFISA